jgi:hypothetical protein
MVVQSQPRQIGCEILSGKYWCMAQVVEHLPGKCEALSSNPLSPKKKKKIIDLVCSCCDSRIPQTGKFIKKINSFLTVLEATSLKLKGHTW